MTVRGMAAGAYACAALAAALVLAQPDAACGQGADAPFARTPASVSEGPWRTEYYYLDPRPDALFESLMAALTKDPMLPEDRYSTVVMLSMLLARNPERTEEWAEALSSVPATNQSTVWHALVGANTNESVMALEAIKEADDGTRSTIDYLLQTPPRDLPTEPFHTPNRLTELWAAFFVSGDPIYVRRIIQALEWAVPDEHDEMRMLIGGGAYWSLVRNCHAHSKVLEVCREELKSAQGNIQRSLEAVLSEAETKLAKEPCPEPVAVEKPEESKR